jgi:hypothetical protein
MGWFTELCRNIGLAIHHVAHPGDEPSKQVVKKTTEVEQKGNVILRRTTIEEIEIKRDDKNDSPH